MSDDAVANAPDRRESTVRLLVTFAAAFAVALIVATTLRSGPKFTASQPSIEVAGVAMQAARGRAHLEGGTLVLDALGPDGLGVLVAPAPPFAAAEYSRATWHFALAAPPGAEFAMAWQTREQPGRTFTQRIENARGRVDVDLRDHPDWRGSIANVGLVVRGRLDAPLRVTGFSLASNAWYATLGDIFRQWAASPFQDGRTSIGQMSFEERHVAPLLAVVAAAVALALAWIGIQAWRRKERPGAASVAILFLAGWLALDLRWQTLLWREHAAAIRQFAGKTLDEKHASTLDAPIFEVARRIRDADRPRKGRVLVLSDNAHLRTRAAWFLYPENVSGNFLPRTIPAPADLRKGDQIVLLLYRGIAWDRERRLLVWADGRTRAGREILSDGPAFAVVEVE